MSPSTTIGAKQTRKLMTIRATGRSLEGVRSVSTARESTEGTVPRIAMQGEVLASYELNFERGRWQCLCTPRKTTVQPTLSRRKNLM